MTLLQASSLDVRYTRHASIVIIVASAFQALAWRSAMARPGGMAGLWGVVWLMVTLGFVALVLPRAWGRDLVSRTAGWVAAFGLAVVPAMVLSGLAIQLGRASVLCVGLAAAFAIVKGARAVDAPEVPSWFAAAAVILASIQFALNGWGVSPAGAVVLLTCALATGAWFTVVAVRSRHVASARPV